MLGDQHVEDVQMLTTSNSDLSFLTMQC